MSTKQHDYRTMVVYDATTERIVRQLPRWTSESEVVSISPDEKKVIAKTQLSRKQMVRIDNGQVIADCGDELNSYDDILGWTDDSETAILADNIGRVALWSTDNAIRLLNPSNDRIVGFSHDASNKMLTLIDMKGRMLVCDLSRDVIAETCEFSWPTDWATFSRDGKYIAMLNQELMRLALFDSSSRKLLSTVQLLRDHQHAVFRPDGIFALGQGAEKDFRIASYGSNEATTSKVNAGLHQNRFVASKELALLPTEIKRTQDSFTSPPGRIRSTSIGNWRAGLTQPKALPDGKTSVLITKGHTGKINAIDIAPDKGRIASGGQDRVLRIWGRKQNELLKAVPLEQDIHVVRWSPDGNTIAVGSGPNLFLIDPDSGKRRPQLRGYYRQGGISDLSWSPSGKKLIVSNWSNSFAVIDLETELDKEHRCDRPCVAARWISDDDVAFLAVDYTGGFYASLNKRSLSGEANNETLEITESQCGDRSWALSPNRKQALIVGHDAVRVYDLESLSEVASIRGNHQIKAAVWQSDKRLNRLCELA